MNSQKKNRTSRKQVINYLQRKVDSYKGGCIERTHLVRAIEVLKSYDKEVY